MDQLEKLETFLKTKKKKMKTLQKKRMHSEKQQKIHKELAYKRSMGIPDIELGHLIDQLKSLNIVEDEYTSSEDEKKEISEVDNNTDLSDDDNKNNGNITDPTMTAFDEYESKTLDRNLGATNRSSDPEAQAKEEYMRKLMSFRKDELILPEESDDSEDEGGNKNKEKGVAGVEDAYDLVEKVEEKMTKIATVIKGMDKRMSYNLRLIGSMMQPELDGSIQIKI